jgi:LCP family protein required for cell wall assembly
MPQLLYVLVWRKFLGIFNVRPRLIRVKRGNFGRMGRRRRRIVFFSIAGGMAVLLAGVAGAGYALMSHFNANIQQDDITSLLGDQPVDTHPQAENILVMGSDSRHGLSAAYGTGLVTDQSDTMMIVHIPADRQWAEVMSIPRDSWVNIPSCKMGNGQVSSPTQFKINEAFAIGNLYGNHTALGVACTVRTLEQDTGIHIDHFIVVNFTGFENMVAAIGGVPECNPTPINDPLSGLHLSAGHHVLTPAQALGYVRARYTLGNGSDLERIGRQQAFMSSLIAQVQGKLYNPLAIYRFLDSATSALTIDRQLGGITGLYNLGESLRSIPTSKIAFFTIPNFPRGQAVPGDTANVLWTQPEDSAIFQSFINDVPASPSLFGSAAGPPVAQAAGSATAGVAGISANGAGATATGTAAGTGAAGTVSSGATATAGPTAGTVASPTVTASPTASATPPPAVSLQARTANQSICAG